MGGRVHCNLFGEREGQTIRSLFLGLELNPSPVPGECVVGPLTNYVTDEGLVPKGNFEVPPVKIYGKDQRRRGFVRFFFVREGQGTVGRGLIRSPPPQSGE